MTQQHHTDEFSGDEYSAGSNSLPFLQVVHHREVNYSGFFLAEDNAAAVGFNPDQDWSTHEAHLGSDRVPGFRSLSARIVVVRRTPLLMFHRNEKTFLGSFDRNFYETQKESILLKCRYLIYLASKDKKLLHTYPLQFTTKGSLSGSFGQSLAQYREAMNQAYGSKRGDRFFALCVFPVSLTPVLKGQKNKSYVCTVDKFGLPTSDNWQNFFLGYTDAKEKLLQDFEAYADFGNLDR